MTGFAFDAKAELRHVREGLILPTPPTVPTDHPNWVAKVGTVGKVGMVRAFDPQLPPLELELYAARVSALSDTDGVARTPEAIEAVWDWAEALAREKNLTIKKGS